MSVCVVLTAVTEADELIVAGVGAQVILVHDGHARGGHAQAQAADRFHCQTEVRTRLLTHLPRLKTQAADVALAALVLVHIAVEHAVACVESRAGSAEIGQNTPNTCIEVQAEASLKMQDMKLCSVANELAHHGWCWKQPSLREI